MISQYVDREITKFGFSIESILKATGDRFDISNIPVLLAGSIVDELSTEESDVDVLIVNSKEIANSRSMIDEGFVVDTIGLEGGRLQIAQCSEDRLLALVKSITDFLNPDEGQLTCLSTPEKRILHRICTGIPLLNHDLAQKLKDTVNHSLFARYCLVLHTYDTEAALKDALGEIKGEHWLSACTQIQRACTLLGMATLNEIGETNQNPKWVTRLLQKNENRLDSNRLNVIQSGMFPSLELSKNGKEILDLYDEVFSMYEAITKKYPEMFTDKGSEV